MGVKEQQNASLCRQMPKMQQSDAHDKQDTKTMRLLRTNFYTAAEESFYETHKRHSLTLTKQEGVEQWLCRTCAERFDI